MLSLCVFNTGRNLQVFRTLVEILALDLLHIVETGFELLIHHLDLVHVDMNILLESLLLNLSCFILLLMGL